VIVRIEAVRCVGCGVCVDVCPMEAIEMNEVGLAVVLSERCSGCQVCQSACPHDAIIEDPEKTQAVMSAGRRGGRSW